MDGITGLGAFLGGFPGNLIPFILVILVVVFVHEMGHFLVARWNGIKVEAFSIGFGPEIWGFDDRHGTRWKMSLVPLGGYVRFLGDENAASVPNPDAVAAMPEDERATSFPAQNVWRRMAVVAAGPIANFLLAIVIFAAIFMLFGKVVTTAQVDEVSAGSAAEEAGFQPGDVVLEIDGRQIESFSDLQRLVSTSAERELDVLIERDGRELALVATPRRQEVTDRFGNTQRFGVLGLRRLQEGGTPPEVRRYGPVDATILGVQETGFIVERTFVYLKRLVVGEESADQLSGPIRIAQVSGQVASILSIAAILNLIAVLSVSIGLVNLFPIPMLDGGHLLYYSIEAIRGKPLSERWQEYGFRVGLAMVLMLMLFATWNDLSQLDII